MNESRATIEKIAPTIEEAVAQGLAELGLTQEEVEVEILDEGKSGLFGLGSRQARVRLTIKSLPQPQPGGGAAPTENATPSEQPPNPEPEPPSPIVDADSALEIARNTVSELLGKMKVQAEVTAYFGAPEDEKDETPIHVDIHGKDLSILIGRKAETLQALQFIASLIVGKEMGHSVPLVIDVEGYRSRRNKQIRQLTERVAEQVTQTGRSQSLEPMPANERRLVHIALRNHPHVYTQSAGEGDHRKVVIYPK